MTRTTMASLDKACIPQTLLYALQRQGLARTFVLYADGTTGKTRIACDPIARVRVDATHVSLTAKALGIAHREPVVDPFAQVASLLQRLPLRSFRAFGYLGFDLAASYFKYPRQPTDFPVLDLMVPTSEFCLGTSCTQFRTLGDPEPVFAAIHGDAPPPALPQPTALPIQAAAALDDGYIQRVADLIARIRPGGLSKAIISRRVAITGTLDPLATLATAARNNQAPRSYAFDLGETRGAGFSPEIFLQSPNGRQVLTNPLAGTRPRGANDTEDERRRYELHHDPKEVKEHAMSVVCVQDELREVCGTVSVRDFMEIKQFRSVQHLSSRLHGCLRSDKSVWDAARILFPGVTVSGIDKARALEAIGELEGQSRGIYGGAFGWIDDRSRTDFAIAIRSVYQVGSDVCLNAGAGIVRESIPENEYIESVNKMNTMLENVVLV